MAYSRSWLLVLLLQPAIALADAPATPPASTPPSASAPRPKVGLLIDGGGTRRDELAQQIIAKLKQPLDAEVVPQQNAPSDEALQKALRASLGVQRLVIIKIEPQGKDKFAVAIHAVDETGIAHRYTDAGPNTLVPAAVELFAKLPPMIVAEPPPEPVKEEKPPLVEDKPTPAPPPATVDNEGVRPHGLYRRRHPYSVLLAGAIVFLLPYFATVGVAANYDSYNHNAASVGYIPLAGPFLAIKRINDKDLNDGYRIGLTVDGVVQVLTFNILIAGAIYMAVGEKRKEYGRKDNISSLQPLFSFGPEGARVGASMRW
jgi:hypothetical protein